MTKFVGKKKKNNKRKRESYQFLWFYNAGVFFCFFFSVKFVIMEICRNFHNFSGIFFALWKFFFFQELFQFSCQQFFKFLLGKTQCLGVGCKKKKRKKKCTNRKLE
jgi:hypothetical protein